MESSARVLMYPDVCSEVSCHSEQDGVWFTRSPLAAGQRDI